MKLPTFRTLLILGRISNLPTVWSNCLAAWILTSGQYRSSSQLLILIAGCSALYLGGMFLNDAFDVAFDQVHRPERPIPSGQISRRTVTILGTSWLAIGLLLLAPISSGWAWTLAGAILLYTVIHKKTGLGVLIMATCRALIYPVVGFGSLPFPSMLWVAAGCMALWVLALSILARNNSKLSAAVPNLLAAIPLLDLIIVLPHSPILFILFTALALFLRRTIPPT